MERESKENGQIAEERRKNEFKKRVKGERSEEKERRRLGKKLERQWKDEQTIKDLMKNRW